MRERSPSIETLVREYALTRSPPSLEALLERCYPIALRIAELRLGRRLRGDIEAEDVVQEAMVRVFRALPRYHTSSEGAFLSWLGTIVANQVRDLRRSARAAKRGRGKVERFADLPAISLVDALIDGRRDPPAMASASEEERRLEEFVLSELTPSQREVLNLRGLCGQSHAQIARALGYGSASSVRSLYSRLLARLRERLGR